MMFETVPFKKQIYLDLYNKLLSVQKSYEEVDIQLREKIISLIPRDETDIARLDLLKHQLEVVGLNKEKLEEIRYWCNLAVLTEGSLISSDELSNLIVSLEGLVLVASNEAKGTDPSIIIWAEEKVVVFQGALDILYRILEHKLQRKLDTGMVKLQ